MCLNTSVNNYSNFKQVVLLIRLLMDNALNDLIAREAWAEFLQSPTPKDAARLCHPLHPLRNESFDLRDLSQLSDRQFPVELRKALRCEQPSQAAHWRRLDVAARRYGRQLTLVQIGANAGGDEGNEWIGGMVRELGWRAALVEPVPWIFKMLKHNVRKLAPRQLESGQITVHELVVHANANQTQSQSRCRFHALAGECVARSVSRKSGLARSRPNASACPRLKQFHQGVDLQQMGGLVDRRPGAPASQWMLGDAVKQMVEHELPCVHVSALREALGLERIDVLSIDTEGSDYALLRALDLSGPARPLALEFESKAFTNAQLGAVQRQLEAAGYRVFDANAAPGSVHWESRWQIIETMALRTGDDAPLRRVPGGLSCDGFVNGADTYCCRVKTGWWRTRKPGQPKCT